MKPACFLIVIFALIFGLIPDPAAAEAPRSATRIGVILPLTGEYASWSQSIRRAFELIAPQFQKRFSFQFEDEGNCEPARTVSVFQKLKSSGIKFIFVGCLSGTKAILPIANRSEVLLLSLGLVDDAAFQQTTKLINLATQLSTESGYLARHILNRNFKKVAIIHWEDAFSDEFARTLKNSLEKGGAGPVSEHAVQSADNDFRAILLRIKEEKPDAICTNVGEQQQAVLLRQIRQSGITIPVLSNYPFEAEPTLAVGGPFVEGVEYSFPLNSAENNPEKIAFDKEFSKQFGDDAKPTPNSYFARDGVILLNNAFSQCSSEDPECVSKYFRSLTNFNGFSGAVSFLPNGSNIRPYGIKKVDQGKFVWLIRDLKLG
jgi:branched-chain amino acid transport system substrate-binding protein